MRQNIILGIFLLLHAFAGASELDTSLSNKEMIERISLIQTELDANSAKAQVWWYGWIAAFTCITPTSFYLSTTDWAENTNDQGNNRVTYFHVNASRVALGLVDQLLLSPFSPAYAHKRLRKCQGKSPEELKYKLEKGETLLLKNARVVKWGKSWTKRASAFLLHLACCGIVWYKDGYQLGLLTLLTGIAGTEIITYTMPSGSVESWDRYKRTYKTPETASLHFDRKWMVYPVPGGIRAQIVF
jgi:hypothetical protein